MCIKLTLENIYQSTILKKNATNLPKSKLKRCVSVI